MADTITLERDTCQTPGQGKPCVFGFKQQTCLPIAAVVKAIDAVPDFHLVGLTEIRFDPKREYQIFLSRIFNRPHLNRFKAEYMASLGRILIYEMATQAAFFHSLYHELGHHVYFQVLKSGLKKEWVTQVRDNEDAISHYGKRNFAAKVRSADRVFISRHGDAISR